MKFATMLATPLFPRALRMAALILLACLALPHFVRADSDDPLEILKRARMNQAAQSLSLDGKVSHAETVVPFHLTLDGNEITYEFSSPVQTIALQLGDKSSRLVEITKKGTEKIVTDAQYDQPIHGMEITYEDLAMRFLYWPVAKLLGSDIQATRNCWKIRVEPGSLKTQYGYVLVWIEKQSSAPFRVETYDKAGVLLKRFEVRSFQKYEGGYILKQMRIQTMENGEPKDPTPTYLEIQKPKEG